MRVSPRRRAREFVLQGLYQRQLSGNPCAAIRDQVAAAAGFPKADETYFDALWAAHLVRFDQADELVAFLAPRLTALMDTARGNSVITADTRRASSAAWCAMSR